MPAAFFQSTLELGAAMLTATAGLIIETEWVREHCPSVQRAMKNFYELENNAKTRITLLLIAYAIIALAAWRFLRDNPKKRKIRLH